MKSLLKRIVYKYDSIFKLYFNYIYKPKDDLSIFLDNYSKSNKNRLFFIQIGANDGQWGDPIYKFIRRDSWAGLLIEPQKIIFNRLKNNYECLKNLLFENVAIDSNPGERSLYKISFTDSRWASGISSFIKEDIQKLINAGYIERMAKEENISLPTNIDDWISVEKVKTTTLKNLIEKYNIGKIDLIMIDAEGYDFEIIKTIPFELNKPEVIIYEHTHLSTDVKHLCTEFLQNKGFTLTHTESDSIAKLNK